MTGNAGSGPFFFFMKCDLINPDRGPDRLPFMPDQFDSLKSRAMRPARVELVRVPAVDATHSAMLRRLRVTTGIFVPSSRGIFRISLRRGLSKAEIACFLSHRECGRRIAEGPDAFGAVFEDDVVFSDETFFSGRRDMDSGGGRYCQAGDHDRQVCRGTVGTEKFPGTRNRSFSFG